MSMVRMFSFALAILGIATALGTGADPAFGREVAEGQPQVIQLDAARVPTEFDSSWIASGDRQVVAAFREKYPWIDPVATAGLQVYTSPRTMEMLPFM